MGGLGTQQQDIKDRIVHRIKIAKGHMEKVLTMVEEGSYCVDVIDQSKAVQNALKEVDFLLLENHLQTCVTNLAKKRDTESITEIMKVFKRQ